MPSKIVPCPIRAWGLSEPLMAIHPSLVADRLAKYLAPRRFVAGTSADDLRPCGRWRRAGSVDQRPQRVARDQEAALDEILRGLERAVLVLDRDHEVVPLAVEGRDEPVPAHVAETRKPRHLPAHSERRRP